MENSSNKQFISFTSCVILNSVIKSHSVLLHPARDMSHPAVQSVHTVHADHPLIAELPPRLSDSLPKHHSAPFPVTLISLITRVHITFIIVLLFGIVVSLLLYLI